MRRPHGHGHTHHHQTLSVWWGWLPVIINEPSTWTRPHSSSSDLISMVRLVVSHYKWGVHMDKATLIIIRPYQYGQVGSLVIINEASTWTRPHSSSDLISMTMLVVSHYKWGVHMGSRRFSPTPHPGLFPWHFPTRLPPPRPLSPPPPPGQVPSRSFPTRDITHPALFPRPSSHPVFMLNPRDRSKTAS